MSGTVVTLLGYRDFYSEDQIKELVRQSKYFGTEGEESAASANTLLLFRTSKQQTWLVATNQRLYCILDDLRNDSPGIQWAEPRDSLLSGQHVIAKITTSPKSEKTGRVNIGDRRKNWLFSKSLFKGDDVEVVSSIKRLIKNSMQ